MAKNTFTLSANLDNGIVQGTKYIVTPNVRKVLTEVVNAYHTGIHSFSVIGSYGTGKTAFILNLEQDLCAKNGNGQLLNPKVLHDGKYEIINIIGDVRPLSELLFEKLQSLTDSNETDVLKLLAIVHQKLRKQGKFLFIAIDEFGKVLEHAAKTRRKYISFKSSRSLSILRQETSFY